MDDLLTAYNGTAITHDQIGNMTAFNGWTFAWEHGRELASLSKDGTTWTNTYNADGLRTKRTNGSTAYQYVYNGSSLSQMTVGTHLLNFAYDASGSPMAVTYDGVTYYYATNLQGDIVAILDSAGTAVVKYSYDAWGKLLTTTGSMATTLGVHNPLRYRGYVYDEETDLYYLQSRYYDPTLGRFLNADAWVSTGQGPTGNNTFSYCGNNPSNYVDSSGLLRQPTVVAMEDGAKSTYGGGIGVTTGSPVLDAGTAVAGAAIGAALVETAKTVKTSIQRIAQAIARTQEDDPEKGPYYVYVLIDGNKNVQYVARTKKLAARKNAHKANPYRKELKLQEVASNLTYGQARGLEQTLMLHYHILNPSDPMNNQINGISPQNGNKGNYIGAAEGVSGYIWNQISNEVLNWAGM